MNALRYAACALFVASFAASAAQDRVTTLADWTVKTNPEMQQAYTSSNTGATFGVACFLKTETCYVFLRLQNQCDDGSGAPLLMNTSTGAVPLTATCIKTTGDNGQPIFVNSIAEFDNAIRGAEAGGEFGIALPLVSGQFAVFRFSGRGAADAINAARARPAKAPAKTSGDHVL